MRKGLPLSRETLLIIIIITLNITIWPLVPFINAFSVYCQNIYVKNKLGVPHSYDYDIFYEGYPIDYLYVKVKENTDVKDKTLVREYIFNRPPDQIREKYRQDIYHILSKHILIWYTHDDNIRKPEEYEGIAINTRVYGLESLFALNIIMFTIYGLHRYKEKCSKAKD